LAIHRSFSSSYLVELLFDQGVVVHGQLIRSAEKGDALPASAGGLANLAGKERPHFPKAREVSDRPASSN
jgi:hypothetical protein